EPDRDAVLAPRARAPPGPELDDPRLCQDIALDVREQCLLRLVIADVSAAIDHPVAHAMLQRDTPLPARIARDGACVRNRFADGCRLRRDSAVTVEPVRPVLVSDMQRLADEQAAEARAVDEQVALDLDIGVQSQ